MASEPVIVVPLILKYIDVYEATGKPPYKHSLLDRTVGYACFPFCCGLCCVWSTLFRVVGCPFQCATNGAGFMCSNNGCTDCSDMMIGQCCNQFDKKVELPVFSVPKDLTPDNKKALLDLIAKLETLFSNKDGKYSIVHYDLTEKIVLPMVDRRDGDPPLPYLAITPLPADVPKILQVIKSRLEQPVADAIASEK